MSKRMCSIRGVLLPITVVVSTNNRESDVIPVANVMSIFIEAWFGNVNTEVANDKICMIHAETPPKANEWSKNIVLLPINRDG